MITTSDTAEEKLKEMIFHKLSDVGVGFRIREDTDQSNISIKLDFKHVDDHVIDLNGMSVFIDPDCAAGLGTCEFDYIEELGGFYLKTPNRISQL